jgi:hypothetical protein
MVPSSFSSTIWSLKTLSYKVWGCFTIPGIVDMRYERRYQALIKSHENVSWRELKGSM